MPKELTLEEEFLEYLEEYKKSINEVSERSSGYKGMRRTDVADVVVENIREFAKAHSLCSEHDVKKYFEKPLAALKDFEENIGDETYMGDDLGVLKTECIKASEEFKRKVQPKLKQLQRLVKGDLDNYTPGAKKSRIAKYGMVRTGDTDIERIIPDAKKIRTAKYGTSRASENEIENEAPSSKRRH